ncbi:MAG: ComEA family DNA-binding protein [Syntrophobacteraceae bacterium]
MEKDCIKIEWALFVVALAVFTFFSATSYFKSAQDKKHGGAPPIAVQVRGEAVKPGFYLLDSSGATVAEAAAKACCRLKIPESEAAVKLTSGQSLEIYRGKTGVEIKLGRMPASALLACGLKLDLNSASLDDLLLIPHLRPAIAEAIVKGRRLKPWKSLDELLQIRGIGPKTLQKLQGYVEVAAGKPAEGEQKEMK